MPHAGRRTPDTGRRTLETGTKYFGFLFSRMQKEM